MLAIIPYQLSLMESQPDVVDIPDSVIIMINTATQSVITFVLILLGLRMQQATDFSVSLLESFVYRTKKARLSKKWLIHSIVIALIGGLVVILLDVFVFQSLMGEAVEQPPSPSWWQGLLAALYGGINEEILLRLFGMTLIVWLLAKIAKKERSEIPNSFYYIAIIITSVLFGLGHLPATSIAFGGLNEWLIIRAIALNGLMGVIFGYLYWRRGLFYAIIAHMSADVLLHGLIVPLLQ